MLAVVWSHLCALLLVVSGGNKLVDPEPTRGALRSAGLMSSKLVVVALGLWEIVAGATALAFGGATGGLLLFVTYAGFAGFVAWSLKKGLPIQSCGCFGRDDTPPTWGHVAVNSSAALAGLVIAATGGGDIITTLTDQPLLGIPYVVFAFIGVYALYLVLTELPRTIAISRSAT